MYWRYDRVYYIGKIELSIYKAIAEKTIITNEVIITDNRIAHIIERRGQEFYDKYHVYFSSILSDPDYGTQNQIRRSYAEDSLSTARMLI